jgi:hypothetical protein
MSARIPYCFALALLMAAAGTAGADPYQPSVGSAPSSDNSATGSATELPSGVAAYNQAATTDPYNQGDFSAQQSFGLTAAQMLGAAAACEQLHSDRVSLSGQQMANASSDSSDEDRANLDAAQQHMLDPAATSPTDSDASEVDCDRISSSFSQLQQIQFNDKDLAKELDQPDAVSPSANSNNNNNDN